MALLAGGWTQLAEPFSSWLQVFNMLQANISGVIGTSRHANIFDASALETKRLELT